MAGQAGESRITQGAWTRAGRQQDEADAGLCPGHFQPLAGQDAPIPSHTSRNTGGTGNDGGRKIEDLQYPFCIFSDPCPRGPAHFIVRIIFDPGFTGTTCGLAAPSADQSIMPLSMPTATMIHIFPTSELKWA